MGRKPVFRVTAKTARRRGYADGGSVGDENKSFSQLVDETDQRGLDVDAAAAAYRRPRWYEQGGGLTRSRPMADPGDTRMEIKPPQSPDKNVVRDNIKGDWRDDKEIGMRRGGKVKKVLPARKKR